MNSQLIEKVIKTNNETCPAFVYEVPNLDRNVAKALSRSFIKILKISNQNANINTNLRLSVLENIRKMCRTEPENHFKVDENTTALLTEVYKKTICKSITDEENRTDKLLDDFLIRNLKDNDVHSKLNSQFNPDTIQAMINLTGNNMPVQNLDVIHWNTNNSKHFNVVKDIWNNSVTDNTVSEVLVDDVSVKMKPEIEKILLETCCKVLEENSANLEVMFTSDSTLVHLVKTCAISSECFQMCCNILNSLFISTNFHVQIHDFILTFVSYVKIHCIKVAFSSLYPIHLSNLAALLDINLNEMSDMLKKEYIKIALPFLHRLQEEAQNELILLLSHFPDWFDIVFQQTIDN